MSQLFASCPGCFTPTKLAALSPHKHLTGSIVWVCAARMWSYTSLFFLFFQPYSRPEVPGNTTTDGKMQSFQHPVRSVHVFIWLEQSVCFVTWFSLGLLNPNLLQIRLLCLWSLCTANLQTTSMRSFCCNISWLIQCICSNNWFNGWEIGSKFDKDIASNTELYIQFWSTKTEIVFSCKTKISGWKKFLQYIK